MPYFNIGAKTNENTVVTTCAPLPKRTEAYKRIGACPVPEVKAILDTAF